MPQSVPSASEVQATYAATLFDEWIRLGLRDVVLCPGSRSTPLALACASRRELRVHVRIDERSAGFFALGRALATHEPVAIVVTSGTAAAELHACVAEASQAFVPLLVLTADRPPELHGVGAPQTIDQHRLFGDLVRLFEDPGTARPEDSDTWRVLARRLWSRATQRDEESPSPGPVHLNAAFIEPLVAEALALPDPLVPISTSRERYVNSAGSRRRPGAVRRRSRRLQSDGGGLRVVELGRRRGRHGSGHHFVLRRAVARRAVRRGRPSGRGGPTRRAARVSNASGTTSRVAGADRRLRRRRLRVRPRSTRQRASCTDCPIRSTNPRPMANTCGSGTTRRRASVRG